MDFYLQDNFCTFKQIFEFMTATYSLSRSELNADFLEALKKTFKSERVFIQIEEEIDETERIELNKPLFDKVVKASNQMKKGKHIVKFEGTEFMEKYGSL